MKDGRKNMPKRKKGKKKVKEVEKKTLYDKAYRMRDGKRD